MLVVGLLASVVTFAVGTGVALAHHTVLSASVDCARTVSFTATSWSTGVEGSNPKIEVGYTYGADPTSVVVTTGAFGPGSEGTPDSFSGTFQWPASNPESITVYSVPRDNWGDGVSPEDPATFMLSKPGECSGTTGASVGNIKCVSNNTSSADVTFAVTGGNLSSVFQITSPSGYPTQTVAPGVPVTVTLSNLANNGAFQVSYTVDGGAVRQTASVKLSCSTGTPSAVAAAPVCAAVGSASVTVTFSVDGGSLPSTFHIVSPADIFDDFTVQPGATNAVTKTFTDLVNGPFQVSYSVDGNETVLTTNSVSPDCENSPGIATAVSECSGFRGTVTITLTNSGGQFAAMFVVDGKTYTVVAGTSHAVLFENVPDGTFTKTVTINGVDRQVTVEGIKCGPRLTVAPVCNEVDVNGVVTAYWFAVSNPESGDVAFTWGTGSATAPAKGGVKIKSTTGHIDLKYGGATIVSSDASTSVCGTNVSFEKKLVGQPPSGETYTVKVSRLVGANYVMQTTFDLQAGVPKTFTLPSTLDPDGISYKVEETVVGTAVTHVVSPDSFNLAGNLGETVSVVVTNGYASVRIDKTVSAITVRGGDSLIYTLTSTNTGGLTLNPVVISDLLPSQLSLLSASVAGDKGKCTVVQVERPQLIECVMNDALPPGGVTPAVTLVAMVDANIAADANIVNQAKVLGTYGAVAAQAATPSGPPSCIPVPSGKVCALSAKIGTLVQGQTQSEPPIIIPPTTATPPSLTVAPVASLPVTGASGISKLLTIGFVLLSLGGVVVLARRRRPSRS